jgi:SAM-dependent methyltransferase
LRATLPSDAQLVATDVNQAMLDCARARLRNVAQVVWKRADCAALPFASASFSALACQFGVMFVANKRAVVREGRRVVVNGGLLAFNVWASLPYNVYARVAQEAAARTLGAEATHFFDVAYGSADIDAWCSLLRAHNFAVQELDWLELPVYSPTAERLALGFVHGTPLRGALEVLGGQPGRVVEAVSSALARLGGEAPFRSTMRALVITAIAR